MEVPMSVKASVSISKQQNEFARKLVEEGRYASISAVVQSGLEMLRTQTENRETELLALRQILNDRQEGGFVSLQEGRAATAGMIAAKRKKHGL